MRASRPAVNVPQLCLYAQSRDVRRGCALLFAPRDGTIRTPRQRLVHSPQLRMCLTFPRPPIQSAALAFRLGRARARCVRPRATRRELAPNRGGVLIAPGSLAALASLPLTRSRHLHLHPTFAPRWPAAAKSARLRPRAGRSGVPLRSPRSIARPRPLSRPVHHPDRSGANPAIRPAESTPSLAAYERRTLACPVRTLHALITPGSSPLLARPRARHPHTLPLRAIFLEHVPRPGGEPLHDVRAPPGRRRFAPPSAEALIASAPTAHPNGRPLLCRCARRAPPPSLTCTAYSLRRAIARIALFRSSRTCLVCCISCS